MKINISKEIEFWKKQARQFEFLFKEQKRIIEGYTELINEYLKRIEELENEKST